MPPSRSHFRSCSGTRLDVALWNAHVATILAAQLHTFGTHFLRQFRPHQLHTFAPCLPSYLVLHMLRQLVGPVAVIVGVNIWVTIWDNVIIVDIKFIFVSDIVEVLVTVVVSYTVAELRQDLVSDTVRESRLNLVTVLKLISVAVIVAVRVLGQGLGQGCTTGFRYCFGSSSRRVLC